MYSSNSVRVYLTGCFHTPPKAEIDFLHTDKTLTGIWYVHVDQFDVYQDGSTNDQSFPPYITLSLPHPSPSPYHTQQEDGEFNNNNNCDPL